jgi:riboflavin kinase / FMN adenylyltransferase
MEIISDIKEYQHTDRSCVTIGNFDGLHLGHKRILDDVVKTARQCACRSILVTFEPHPLDLLRPGQAPLLITTPQEKTSLIEGTGIDVLLVLKFDASLAQLEGKDFVQEVLCSRLQAKHIFVGRHFVFGHRRSGNVALLEQMGKDLDFEVHVIPQVIVRGTRVSSTWIRELVQSGRISMANRLMGHFYTLSGKIVAGQGLGRRFLVPTLNMDVVNAIIPKPGVYVTMAGLQGQGYPSVTNVGRRPTVEGLGLTIETHVLNTGLRSTPATMELSFLHHLRNEKKFDTLDALKVQIDRDCQRAERFFRLLDKVRHL